ncbi:O-antigen ligase family protein [Maridesulfovibrio hydrothermalis]|uniref:O-antigen ligase-related domain-containing protein n=1 Tax=Maridesulfovibrio hydrothermalis AM13 = DSM 14728 TaxID=1121451 RepID=L0RF53_9BACT|nr:O-antigen ligase family protein [Maridesulfovibrio hydrothermalis]CCO24835.1 conserved membrane protein of unknown function [Maridesulfovibrio hydrothermalis AM13 = DSM 14728]
MTFLLSLFFFFRPIMFIDIGWLIFGLNITEFFAVFATIILICAFVLRVVVSKQLNISIIDFFIMFFIVWCSFIYVLYIDTSSPKDVAKFTLPFFTYIVMKNVIKDRKQYMQLLKLMIFGFAIPVFSSAILILQGMGLDRVMYWTGLYRFQGVYVNPHNLGHCMAFLLMIMAIYSVLCYVDPDVKDLRKRKLLFLFFITMGLFALYCLYKSYVRTCLLGLGVFVYYYLFKINKRLLLVLTGVLCLLGVLFAALLYTIFFDMIDAAQGKERADYFGSGRPYIWKHNLNEFSNLSLDRMLAGVGVGNRRAEGEVTKKGVIWNSHNDFLEVMMQTGLVGLFLYLALQICIYRRIRRLEGKVLFVFLALFYAVNFMNFVSNSYVTRFGLGQLFYAVLAFIEIPDSTKKEVDEEDSSFTSGISY